jgi:hypothetical protein
MKKMTKTAMDVRHFLFSFILITSWGGRIRTPECGNQNPVSYRLTTPQFEIGALMNMKESIIF